MIMKGFQGPGFMQLSSSRTACLSLTSFVYETIDPIQEDGSVAFNCDDP